MVTALGRLATSVAAKFGLCTRKAAIRLASETGCKLVDESARLGRNLNNQEIEAVFKQTLPKKLRPKILGSKEETVKQMAKRGLSDESAQEFMSHDEIFGVALTHGAKKAPLFVDMSNVEKIVGKNDFVFGNSSIAHELEHAIEYNNRLKKIVSRKIIGPIMMKFKKDPKAFLKQINNDNLKFQESIQRLIGQPDAERLTGIKSTVEQLSNGSKKKLKLFKTSLNLEIPAYTTGYNVELYGAKKLGSSRIFQGLILRQYKDTFKIVKQT